MKKLSLIFGTFMYILSALSIIFYFTADISNKVILTPSSRIALFSLICILMYIGAWLLPCRDNREKILRMNLFICLLLYIIMIFTLTLFDDFFFRNKLSIFNWDMKTLKNYINNSFNIIPFATVISYIAGFIRGEVGFYIFVYNIFGNLALLAPLGFFLPMLFSCQRKFKNFFFTILGFIVSVELLQFFSLSGSCDIDDIILNTLGACITFGILQIKSVRSFLEKIFLAKR